MASTYLDNIKIMLRAVSVSDLYVQTILGGALSTLQARCGITVLLTDPIGTRDTNIEGTIIEFLTAAARLEIYALELWGTTLEAQQEYYWNKLNTIEAWYIENPEVTS